MATIHKDLVGATAIHQASYIQAADPGAVGAWKTWIDITTPSAPIYNYRNAGNTAWVVVTAALGAHATSHQIGGSDAIKLDDLAAPDDNTDLNASTTKHGLLQKLPGGTTTFLRADGAFAAAGGGGSGSEPEPYNPPASPSSFDDEFTAATLDAKWTETISPDASFTKFINKFASWVGMEGTGHATNHYVLRQPLTGFGAGTAFQVTAKMSIGWKKSPTGNPEVRIGLSNNATWATGTYTRFGIVPTSDTVKFQENNGALNVNDDSGAARQGVSFYVHIQRATSNDIRWYVSHDGISWTLLQTANRSFAFDYLWLSFLASTAASNPSRMVIDWVRVNDARFTQAI